MAKQSYSRFLPVTGLLIVGMSAIFYSISTDEVEKYIDATAIIQARDVSGKANLGSDVDVWRVRMTGSGLLVIARSSVGSNHTAGDCVMVRQFSGSNLFERRATITGPSTRCEL
jgi:hypothetical protein